MNVWKNLSFDRAQATWLAATIALAVFLASGLTDAATWEKGWNDPNGGPTAFTGKCENKHYGSWSFPGAAPWGCDARNYGESYRAEVLWAPFTVSMEQIHPQQPLKSADPVVIQNREEHLRAYMTQTYLLIRQLGTHYYKSRRPTAGDDEIEAWVQAFLTVAAHETNFSHFRKLKEDSPLMIVMGDQNKSIGMVQIFLQAHGIKRTDHYFDLARNLLYGMDHYYLGWEIAERKGESCFPVKNFGDQSRAAYSIYNGGLKAACRWKTASKLWHEANPGCKFGSKTDFLPECEGKSKEKLLLHDLNYERKLKARPWMLYVDAKPDTELSADVDCLMRGNDLCVISPQQKAQVLTGTILTYHNPEESNRNVYCVVGENEGETLYCTYGDHDVACLGKFGPIRQFQKVYRLTDPDRDFHRITYADRHALCLGAVEGLVPVGGLIRPLKSIAIRPEPARGGRVIGSTGTKVFQVVDFYIEPGLAGDRFYKVAVPTKLGIEYGYFYAGSSRTTNTPKESHWDRWAKSVTSEQAAKLGSYSPQLPQKGEVLQLITEASQPVWLNTSGPTKHNRKVVDLQPGSVFEVLDFHVIGESFENRVNLYIRLKNGSVGYLYVGQVSPQYTLDRYVKRVIEEGASQ